MNPLTLPQSDAPASFAPGTAEFLSFSAHGPIAGLLPASQLLEILAIPIETIVPISSTPEAVMGVCNWRGEVLWLLDFGVIVQAGRLCDQALLRPQYDVVIAQSSRGPIGLVVSAIGQLHWIDPSQVQPEPPTARLALPSYFQGYWHGPNGGITGSILDVEQLLVTLAQLSAPPRDR
jgi:positive phototaxis protein PixI